VTAAMPSGTGLDRLIKEFPDRFWDVAIAEQHAITSMAAMAKEGFKPFVAIYSTFLQRGYDQIVHDVCIDNYPVRFAIDRAGIVGADGETHQGVFDVGFLRIVPNMILFAPRDNETLKNAIKFAYQVDSNPVAFRYPRGGFILDNEIKATEFELGRGEIIKNSDNIMLIGYGNGVGKAYRVSELLKKDGIDAGVLDLRFVKPLDIGLLNSLKAKKWYVFSDNVKNGGVAELICSYFKDREIYSFEYPDKFIPHGDIASLERELGVDINSIYEKIKKDLDERL
jgi:1-deoxy-D-xylulose-5-phosphate synthase